MNRVRKILLNVPKNVYKWLTFVFVLIDAICFGLSTILEKIEVFDISSTYNSILAIFPWLENIAEKYTVVFVGLTFVWLFLWLYRPRLLLLEHTSFAPDIADIEAEFLRNYYVKTIKVDECELMKNNMDDGIIRAIDYQDRVINDLKMKGIGLCYYGIAHTPLVFRMGFKMGDQSNLKFLHKLRSNDSLFQEWSNEGAYAAIQSNEFNKTVSSQELIVSISTSLEIKKEDLLSLQPENKHILMFKTNNLSFDNITSYSVAENYRTTIMIGIRECVKKYQIKRIHLVISSSVAFTFFLGQAFSNQHDPITIIYHYQNNEYRWGICINEASEKALVINNVSYQK